MVATSISEDGDPLIPVRQHRSAGGLLLARIDSVNISVLLNGSGMAPPGNGKSDSDARGAGDY